MPNNENWPELVTSKSSITKLLEKYGFAGVCAALVGAGLLSSWGLGN